MTLQGQHCHALPLTIFIFTNYAWMLPSPSGVYMDSINMRHMLRWHPLLSLCEMTTLYSVQFQGEFELRILNGSWLEAPECQRTPQIHCDMTFDLGSDSNYNIRVRAECGTRVSPWVTLNRPFNRRYTLLAAPDMQVSIEGDVLVVSFKDLTVGALVTIWKRGEELQASTELVEHTPLTIHALQEGMTYCVRAQIQLAAQNISSSTDTQCVTVSASDAQSMRPTTVTLTIVAMAIILFAVFLFIVNCNPESFLAYFRKETLPLSLQNVQIVRLKFPEEADVCGHVM